MRFGATPLSSNETEFVVWAPNCERVDIDVAGNRHELHADDMKYFRGRINVGAGTRYRVVPDGKEGRPDPASRYQPDGVHGDSQVVSPEFAWTDKDWRGRPLHEYIIYELHVGTFTREGTFDAAIERLDYLRDLGITSIELMPVAQFPGERNWGYDGVLPYAVQNSYGGPEGLKRLINAAHERGIACLLDVVYNHLGPEGNYVGEFAPIFTQKYKTPWGPAVNVDGEWSDGVREFFIQNAVEWIRDYHFDGLRLDAVHGILDTSAKPFLGELSDAVHAAGRELDRDVVVIAESELNDVRMISPTSAGGMGMDGQWMDDFHHGVHTLLTGELEGYYADYGRVEHLATALKRGYLFAGEYSTFRKRRHGNDPSDAKAKQFVVCVQNHDQIGNRMMGDRLATLVDYEKQKLAASCLLLSPFTPLLFMGEEYGETKPFPYFIDHSDKQLVEAVREGRREEFSAFAWKQEPPDPQGEDTFTAAKIEPHTSPLLDVYKALIDLRKKYDLGPGKTEERDVVALENAILVNRLGSSAIYNFSTEAKRIELPIPRGLYAVAFNSAGSCWGGSYDQMPATVFSPGNVTLELAPTSAVLLVAQEDQ